MSMIKFEIERIPFLNAVKTIGLVATKSKDGHFIEMECRAKGINLFAQTDGEVAIQMSLDSSIDKFEYTPTGSVLEGAFVLIYENLREPLQKIDSDTVIVEYNENLLTVQSTGDKKIVFKLNNPPKYKNGMWNFEMSKDKKTFENAIINRWIDKTVFATSKDGNAIRAMLNGVNVSTNVEEHTGELTLRATDSYRMSQIVTEEKISENIDFTANAQHLKLVQKILKAVASEKVEASLSDNDNFLILKANNCMMEIRNIKCVYPSTSKFFTAPFNKRLTVDKYALKDAIERSQIMVGSNEMVGAQFVQLNINSDCMEVVKNSAAGDFKEKIEGTSYNGEPITINFYNKYILEAIDAINGDILNFDIVDDRKQILVTGNETEGEIVSEIVLPVHRYS